MTQLAVALVIIAIIAAFFLGWYFNFQAKKEERMFLLEKGADPSDLPERGIMNVDFAFPWLKLGTIFLSGTIGLLIGVIMGEFRVLRSGGEPLLGMLIFGGIGLILAHYVGRSSDQS